MPEQTLLANYNSSLKINVIKVKLNMKRIRLTLKIFLGDVET